MAPDDKELAAYRRQLSGAVMALPLQQRQIIEMAVMQDTTFSEMAAILKITEAEVRSIYCAAYQQLYDAMS